jgi:hypothetical protein
VVADYNAILTKAEAIYAKLPKAKRDAFYQIVLFPVKACAMVNELYYAAARNQLYASQQRASANIMAAKTRTFFTADTALMTHYNKVFANGRWNHFMDQTHLGYTIWSPPRRNSLNAVKLTELIVPDAAGMGVALEGSELSWPSATATATLPVFDRFSNKQHYIEVFNKGKQPFDYTVSIDVPWLSVSESKGTVGENDKRIVFALIENKLPKKTGW